MRLADSAGAMMSEIRRATWSGLDGRLVIGRIRPAAPPPATPEGSAEQSDATPSVIGAPPGTCD